MNPAARRWHDSRPATRVAMVDPSNYTPYYDYYLCRALRGAGCRVELLTSRFIYEALPFAADPWIRYHFFRLGTARGRGRRLADARPMVRRALKGAEYPVDIVRLVATVARDRPDVVHFQWLLKPGLELLAARMIRGLGCRLVYTVHNVQPHAGTGMTPEGYREIYDAMDALIVHAESAKRELAGVLDGRADKIAVIPHGSLFEDQAPLERGEARRRLGLPEEGGLILFFGLIERYKGLDCLIRALPRVVRERPDVKLVVAGKPGDGFASTAALLDRTGMAAHTVVRGGFVPSAEVAAYFSAADVVALPYLGASQSGVLLTAYTFGRPVVVTRVGAMGETVAADGTGHVVAAGDAAALADALLSLLSDREAAEGMGRAALRLARTHYSWPRIAGQTMAAYHDAGREKR